jgi:YD repeat-containing protein
LVHVGLAEVDPSGIASVAFTYDRYGHVLSEVDRQAAAELTVMRSAAHFV